MIDEADIGKLLLSLLLLKYSFVLLCYLPLLTYILTSEEIQARIDEADRGKLLLCLLLL